MSNPLIQRYEKVHQSGGLFHMDSWWTVEVEGSDAKDYLQRMGTGDIAACLPGQACQTLFLKGDGRMLADCIGLCVRADRYLLICPAACGQNLLDQLDRFLFTESVTVSNVTESTYVGFVFGPSTELVLGGFLSLCKNDQKILSTQVNLAPSLGFSLLLFLDSTFEKYRHSLYENVESHGALIGDSELYATLRIEAGTPEYGRDSNEKTIPLEAGLNSAISFTKGCFPGQEIVARIHNLGHPANILVGLELPETTQVLTGRKLFLVDKAVGSITSGVFSPALSRFAGLGYTKWALRESGTVLRIEGDENYTAIVKDLPLSKASE